MNEVLLYIGGGLTTAWGVAHLFPTTKVVRGFGAISRDNQLVLTMEWISEGILLIFAGVLVTVTAARFGAKGPAPATTFTAAAVMLVVLAAVSARTGARVHFVMYRLCVPIFLTSAALILAGTYA